MAEGKVSRGGPKRTAEGKAEGTERNFEISEINEIGKLILRGEGLLASLL
jgi:hypothetical protein